MKVDFNNTKNAFAYKSNLQLKKAQNIFKLMKNKSVVALGSWATKFALKIKLPINYLIRKTIFEQFCGGENVVDSAKRIKDLEKYNVGTILDYSSEGKDCEDAFDKTVFEIIKTIDKAKENKSVPFSVFKVTGLARMSVLEAANKSEDNLKHEDKKKLSRIKTRINDICKYAYENNVPIFIDAEDSWIQGTIDRIAENMMLLYNKKETIVFTTLQFYRWDRLDYLKELHKKSISQNYKLGIKLVRGAYMEKERNRAVALNYIDPIQKTKENTDNDFNLALEYCVENINDISICAGTHNEESSMLLIDLMHKYNIPKNDSRVYFSQLLGMSDHISFNLSKANYNIAKYVPYGPIKEVMPYLIRRAEENSSVSSQSSRELSLIEEEIKRRKNIK